MYIYLFFFFGFAFFYFDNKKLTLPQKNRKFARIPMTSNIQIASVVAWSRHLLFIIAVITMLK